MWEYERIMKEYVGNMKEYVKNMKKYVNNMKEYVGNMKEYVENIKKYVKISFLLGSGTQKNSELCLYIGSGTRPLRCECLGNTSRVHSTRKPIVIDVSLPLYTCSWPPQTGVVRIQYVSS